MNDIKKVRERAVDGENPFPMIFKLEEYKDKFCVTPVDAQGIEGPPICGNSPSQCLARLTTAMVAAEEVATAMWDAVEKEVSERASKN